MKLNKDEKALKKSIDRGDFEPVSKAENVRVKKLFKHAAKKITRINIRLSDDAILKLKARAEREGIPYQTLIGSVLHKFINGTLVDVFDVETVKKLLKRG